MLEVGVLKGQVKLFRAGASMPLSHIIFADGVQVLYKAEAKSLSHGGHFHKICSAI